MLLLFLKANWLPILVTILLASGIGYIKHIINQNDRLKAEAIVLNNNLKIEHDNVTVLRRNIDTQNDAITIMQTESKARTEKAIVDLEIARKTANLHTVKASRIVSAVPDNNDKCKAAESLLNSILGEIK